MYPYNTRENSVISLTREGSGALNSVHPLPKVLITVIYIFFVVSAGKHELLRALIFAVYPITMFFVGRLSLAACIKRIWLVLPLVCFIGIFDPLLNKSDIYVLGLSVNSGIVSMTVLIVKGILAVIASYILAVTTTIEKICLALRMLKIPRIIVVQIMLMHRYLILFLKEVLRVSNAYKLRAPGQKGIHISAWGSLVGQMLLRTVDRADEVYESMSLRGFNIDVTLKGGEQKICRRDIVFLIFWILVFSSLKFLIKI